MTVAQRPESRAGAGLASREGWRTARGLLRGPLRTLVTGQALGQGADGLAQIAFAQLVLFDIERGTSPARIAGVLAATLLPFSLVGPFAGVVIDRWDRRRVLVSVSIARTTTALVAIAIVPTQSEPLAYIGILLLLSSSRFVLAAKGAALPTTVAADQLVTANAVSALVGMIAAFAGAVIGSTFVGVTPAAGFTAAAACYALAAMSFRTLPPVGGGGTGITLVSGARRAWQELIDGTRAIARTSDLRRPLAIVWCHRLLLGAGFILLVLIADERERLEISGYGLALGVTGVASLVGTIAAPTLARRYRAVALLPSAFALSGLAGIVGGYWPNLPVLVSGVALVALAFQTLKVLVDALVGHAAEDRVRGRVFAAYDVIYNVAFVLAGLALIPLWELGRERALLWLLAAAFMFSGLLVARATRSFPFDRPHARSQKPAARWRARTAALVAGAVPVLSFPTPAWWWLAWFALVPMLLVIRSAPSGREAAIRSWCSGTGFIFTMHHWLLPNLGPFIVPLSLALGALWLPWGRLVWETLGRSTPRRVLGALTLVPAGWVTIEAVRSWSSLGGPWGLMGASQWNFRPTLAPAELGGVWLVSYLVVAANVAIVIGTSRASTAGARTAGVAVVLAAIGLGPCWYALRPEHTPPATARVAVVQPGVVPGRVARFDAGEQLTQELAGATSDAPVDLVVWGESSVGFDLTERPDIVARLERLSRDAGADLLVNVDSRRGLRSGIYKSSVLITPSGISDTYDKMRLVPFGEYIPLRFAFGWAARITEAAAEDRRRGEDLAVFRTGGLRVGPLVCFESAFPDMSRNLANRDVDLIVIQSATSTFQQSWAPAQHASLAALRAVETGRPVVHATLTGETSAFDAEGGRLARLSTSDRGWIVVTIPLDHATTLYDRVGDWVPMASLGVLILAGVMIAFRRATIEPRRAQETRRKG